jgi:putative membrane protein
MVMLLVKWALSAVALLFVATIAPGITVAGWTGAFIAALVLGLVNAVIRPILVILTLPVTILTLGLFIFVINALLFWFVGSILQGFVVTGFVAALIGSLIYSVLSLIINAALNSAKK